MSLEKTQMYFIVINWNTFLVMRNNIQDEIKSVLTFTVNLPPVEITKKNNKMSNILCHKQPQRADWWWILFLASNHQYGSYLKILHIKSHALLCFSFLPGQHWSCKALNLHYFDLCIPAANRDMSVFFLLLKARLW